MSGRDYCCIARANGQLTECGMLLIYVPALSYRIWLSQPIYMRCPQCVKRIAEQTFEPI